MRIVSYNVNGLRPRLTSPPRTLSAFLDSLDADIICLQETKISRQDLTADLAVAEGYESFFSFTRTSQKGRIGYSGVATFCRVGLTPSSTSPILPLAADEGFTGLLHRSQSGEMIGGQGRVGCYEEVAQTELSLQQLLRLDSEGRCLITDHGSFVLFNLYCPRVDCGDNDRMEFKLNFLHALQRRWEALLKHNRRIIAIGDFNISPYAIDSCHGGPGFDKHICRKWVRSLLKNEGGQFWDVFRFIHPDRKEAYTCWSQASGAEVFNFGTRIDLILAAGSCSHEVLSKSSCDKTTHGFVECEVQDSDILSEFRRMKPDAHPRWQEGRITKLEGSDHAPIFVHLRQQSSIAPHEVPPLAARFMPEIRGRQQNLIALLKRQPSISNLKDAESKTQPSRLVDETCSRSQVASVQSHFGNGASLPSSNNKRKSSMKVSGKNRKVQDPPSSALGAKQQGMASQQKNLHTFFISSKTKCSTSPAASDTKQPNSTQLSDSTVADVQSGQSFPENRDLLNANITGNSSSGLDEGLDVEESRVSDQLVIAMNEDSEDQNASHDQGQSNCRGIEHLDVDHILQLEQIRSSDGTKGSTAASAWTAIKEKMAKAVPLCKGHDEPCVSRIVKKPGPNLGRGFYVCARAEGPASNPEARCDHFEWASSFKKGRNLQKQVNR